MLFRSRPLDVDDLILAAVGAAIGYVPLGRMFGMRLHPDHLHWWQRALARVADRRKAERASKQSKPAKRGLRRLQLRGPRGAR